MTRESVDDSGSPVRADDGDPGRRRHHRLRPPQPRSARTRGAAASIRRTRSRNGPKARRRACCRRRSCPGLYLLRPRFLTKAESVVYLLLKAAFPRNEIFARVRLADVLQVKIGPQGMERLRAFRKIANQHVGFVVCDRDMTIIAIVDSKEPDQVDQSARPEARGHQAALPAGGAGQVHLRLSAAAAALSRAARADPRARRRPGLASTLRVARYAGGRASAVLQAHVLHDVRSAAGAARAASRRALGDRARAPRRRARDADRRPRRARAAAVRRAHRRSTRASCSAASRRARTCTPTQRSTRRERAFPAWAATPWHGARRAAAPRGRADRGARLLHRRGARARGRQESHGGAGRGAGDRRPHRVLLRRDGSATTAT